MRPFVFGMRVDELGEAAAGVEVGVGVALGAGACGSAGATGNTPPSDPLLPPPPQAASSTAKTHASSTADCRTRIFKDFFLAGEQAEASPQR